MPKINEIEIRSINMLHIAPGEQNVIPDMFLTVLNRLKYYSDARSQFGVAIWLTDIIENHLVVDEKCEGIVAIGYKVEVEFYKNAGNDIFKKKKFWFEIVYNCMLAIAEKFSIEKKCIEETRQYCLGLNLENKFYFQNKILPNKTKEFYIAVWEEYDIGKYESYLVLFDKDKKELRRVLIYKESFKFFYVNKLKWITDSIFMYKFNIPKKEFLYNIDTVLNNKIPSLPDKMYKLFK